MQSCLALCPAFLAPAQQQRLLDPLMNQFLPCCSFCPTYVLMQSNPGQEEAGWVIWNFWLGVTGKLFNVIKNSVCRSSLSKQGQCWQSRDAFLLQMLAARGWRRAALGRQRFRALRKDAQWLLLVSLQQYLCLQAFWRQWSRLVVLLLCSAAV